MVCFTVCSQILDLKFKLHTSNKIYKAKQSEHLFLYSSSTELLLLQGSSITDFRQEVFSPHRVGVSSCTKEKFVTSKRIVVYKVLLLFWVKINFRLWINFGPDDTTKWGFLQDNVVEWTPPWQAKSLIPNPLLRHCISVLTSRSGHVCWGLKFPWPLLVGSSHSRVFFTIWFCLWKKVQLNPPGNFK